MEEKDLSKSEEINEELHKEKKKSEKAHLKEEIETLKKEVETYKDHYLRERAELENFKKRTHQERLNERKYAAQSIIESLITPINQLKMVTNYPTDHELLKNYLIGFKMISDQLNGILENEGLTEIKALNEPFDPTKHHAIEKVNIADKPNGVVVEVTQNGYMFKERVIIPAMVKVNEWSDENGNN